MSLHSNRKFAQRCARSLARLRDNQRLGCGFWQPSRMASCLTQRVAPARGRPWLYGAKAPTTHAQVGEMCMAGFNIEGDDGCHAR